MHTPAISIIVPVYNNEDDVQDCLDSIAAQTYTNWEAVCVDDGSTDTSGILLDQMAARDPRFKVVHQVNGGVSSARNTGLKHVSAPYIIMVDSDDWLETHALETLYTSMQQNPCDMVVAGWKRVFKTKAPIISLPAMQQGMQNAIPSQLFFKVHPGPFSKLYKRDIIIAHNIRFPEGITMGEDLLFNTQYWCYTRQVYCLKEAIYNYRESNTSVTGKFESGNLPFSVYEMTVRLPYIMYEMVSSCQEGVHKMNDWSRAILAVHMVEQSWAIDDALHTKAVRKELRLISRKYYNRLASQLELADRICIRCHYCYMWCHGRTFRILGKVKRTLKRLLRTLQSGLFRSIQ